MGSRGPLPKTRQQLALVGSRRAVSRGDPMVLPVAKPTCPEQLAREGKAEWRRLTAELLAAGVLARIDRAALANLCMLWDLSCRLYVRLCKLMDNPSADDQALRRVIAEHRGAVETHAKMSAAFGATPASRARVPVGDAADDGDDELDKFVGGIDKHGARRCADGIGAFTRRRDVGRELDEFARNRTADAKTDSAE